MEKFTPHATLKTNWQERKCGIKRRASATGDRERELEKTLETQGVLNTRRRRVAFVLDYFLY
jgi:hypothetical protein